MKNKQDVVNEFVAVFAQQGVVFTDDEIENIFSFYTHKLHGLVKELNTREKQNDIAIH